MPSSLNLASNNTDVKHLVWIQTSFLGDIIIATAALNLARQQFPNVKQYLITTKVGELALQGETLVDRIITFDKKNSGLGAMQSVREQLKGLRRDDTIVLQTHRSFRSSLLARYLGFQTITFRQSNMSWLAQHRVERVATLHEAARLGLVLEPLGVSREAIIAARPTLLPKEKKVRETKRIGIAPGSVWGTKRWPKEKYAELAAALLDSPVDLEIVILGSPDEKEQADFIANKLSSVRIKNLAGQTSIAELKHEISQLDLLVANDSSPIHFASAYDIPTVAIFGATVPSLGFGPLATNSTVAEIALECRPCSDHGPQVCPLSHFKCMRNLYVEQVYKLCVDQISSSKN